jgi:hypothetical protein
VGRVHVYISVSAGFVAFSVTDRNEINTNPYLTAVISDAMGGVGVNPPGPVVFTVDHPFLAFIVDDINTLPLFASRVADPTAS